MSTRRRAICAAVTVASATVACRHGSVEAPAVWVAASERSPARAAPAATAAKTSTASITAFDLSLQAYASEIVTSLATQKITFTQPRSPLTLLTNTPYVLQLHKHQFAGRSRLASLASPRPSTHVLQPHKITSSTWRRRCPPCRAAGSRGHQSSRAAPGCTGRSVGATSGACQSM